MFTKQKEENVLQKLCRLYLEGLRDLANRHGLGQWISNLICANRGGDCEATEREVELLASLCNDGRIARIDVPSMLGVSYRYCIENGIFERLKKYPHVGIYSKVDVELFKAEHLEELKKHSNE